MTTLLRYSQISIYAATFLYSIYSLYSKKGKEFPFYMKGFYWYPAIGTIIGIIWILSDLKVMSVQVFDTINSLSLLFHFSFLSYFISKVVNNKILKKKLFYLFWFFEILIIISLLYDFRENSKIAFTTSNSGLLIFSLIYYYNLMRNIPIDNLLHEASFWIITGILFALCLNLPIIFFGNYLYHISKPIYYTISWIAPFGLIVMYLFFIKGIKCSLHQHRQQ